MNWSWAGEPAQWLRALAAVLAKARVQLPAPQDGSQPSVTPVPGYLIALSLVPLGTGTHTCEEEAKWRSDDPPLGGGAEGTYTTVGRPV